MEKPFIYIGSLPRTGSTVLGEMLSLLPHSFILQEPELGLTQCHFRENDRKVFREKNIDLEAFQKRWRLGYKTKRLLGLAGEDYMVAAFKNELLPELSSCVQQIGVKEVRNSGWRQYLQHFPQMKIILTARDPRDVYLSMYYRMKSGKVKWKEPFSPTAVAAILNGEFAHQKQMDDSVSCLKVKYEDLSTDSALWDKVKAFTDSAIPTIGAVGTFMSSSPKRQEEHSLHKGQITDQRVARWKDEADEQLVKDAQAAFDKMPDFCAFWGYTV